jgi:hypothetical protein
MKQEWLLASAAVKRRVEITGLRERLGTARALGKATELSRKYRVFEARRSLMPVNLNEEP